MSGNGPTTTEGDNMNAQETLVRKYLDGRTAFGVLTGEVDKAAQVAALREGYTALGTLSQTLTVREVASLTGLSRGKVERDVRAAHVMAGLPKVDPVLIVKACNVGTATAIKKATATPKGAGKALREILTKANKDNKDKRAARGIVDQTEGRKVGAPREPRKSVTAEDVVRFIMRSGFTASELDKIARTASLQAEALRKSAASVAKVS